MHRPHLSQRKEFLLLEASAVSPGSLSGYSFRDGRQLASQMRQQTDTKVTDSGQGRVWFPQVLGRSLLPSETMTGTQGFSVLSQLCPLGHSLLLTALRHLAVLLNACHVSGITVCDAM